MITGFNTDVKHNAKVYHVQTEDKGRNNPKIESLVYVGGEILDNYRTSYERDKGDLSEDEIMELLEAQHKRVIRAIKLGKYDEASPFEEGLITNRGLEEVIADYLQSEPCQDSLKVTANGLASLFRDHSAMLQIETRKAERGDMVEGAAVRVKMTAPGSSPMLLNKGVTNNEGQLSLSATLPKESIPQAELVIQAISEWGVAEQRYPLHRGN